MIHQMQQMMWSSGSSAKAFAPAHRLRCSSALQQRAHMHLGRATASSTKDFLARGGDARAVARLRVGKRGSTGAESSSPALHVSRRGVGSPYLWAKDVPRIDASKHAILSLQSNFLQVRTLLTHAESVSVGSFCD